MALLALLVNDSECSKSADAKSILSPGCIYLVSPDAARCCCRKDIPLAWRAAETRNC
jgi:hypothetical protein